MCRRSIRSRRRSRPSDPCEVQGEIDIAEGVVAAALHSRRLAGDRRQRPRRLPVVGVVAEAGDMVQSAGDRDLIAVGVTAVLGARLLAQPRRRVDHGGLHHCCKPVLDVILELGRLADSVGFGTLAVEVVVVGGAEVAIREGRLLEIAEDVVVKCRLTGLESDLPDEHFNLVIVELVEEGNQIGEECFQPGALLLPEQLDHPQVRGH